MELEITDEDLFRIIKISGDLDVSSVIQLDDQIEESISEGKTRLLFDCQGLNYISSPGIGVFTSRIEDHEKGLIYLALFGMQPKVFSIFKVLGLDQLLPIIQTKEEAKAFINDLHQNS